MKLLCKKSEHFLFCKVWALTYNTAVFWGRADQIRFSFRQYFCSLGIWFHFDAEQNQDLLKFFMKKWQRQRKRENSRIANSLVLGPIHSGALNLVSHIPGDQWAIGYAGVPLSVSCSLSIPSWTEKSFQQKFCSKRNVSVMFQFQWINIFQFPNQLYSEA